ncbi:VanZ family protein [Leifsonia sp. NPDC058230]|uniref:VanZ family protein n=1 Tax=Leifsonia sp. NPDC058230 TaxID=3346391 RepID=UPI0036DF68E2
MTRRHPVLSVLTLVYVLCVGWLTLGPQPADAGPDGFVRQLLAVLRRSALLSWLTYDGVEFTANVVLFIPMGVMFSLLFGLRRWWLALAVGVAATCLIEGAQLFIPTRVSDVRDLIANTLGTLLGIALVAAFSLARRPIPNREYSGPDPR